MNNEEYHTEIDIDEPTFPVEDEPPTVRWICLPNNEPAILVVMFDIFGRPTMELNKCMHVIAMDRYNRYHQFEIKENTFEQPELQ